MSGAESINLSIDYVPVKKYDDMKKMCTKRYERIKELEDVCMNALTTLAIINLPMTTPGVATDKELMDIMAESFRQALKEG